MLVILCLDMLSATPALKLGIQADGAQPTPRSHERLDAKPTIDQAAEH